MVLLGASMWLSRDRFDFTTQRALWNVILGAPLLSLALGSLTVSAVSLNGWLSRIRIPGARTVALLAFSLYLTHKEMAHLAHVYLPHLTEVRDMRTTAIYAAACWSGAGVLYWTVERPFVLLREWIEGRTAAGVERQMRIDPAL